MKLPHKRTRLAALVVAALASCAALAQEKKPLNLGDITPGKVRVLDAGIVPDNRQSGTALLRYRLENAALHAQEVRCTLSLEGSGGARDYIRSAEVLATVGAGDAATVSIPLPPVGDNTIYNGCLLVADGAGRHVFSLNSFYTSCDDRNRYFSRGNHHHYRRAYHADDAFAPLYLSKSFSGENLAAFLEEAYRAYHAKCKPKPSNDYRLLPEPPSATGSASRSGPSLFKCGKSSEYIDPWPVDWRCFLPYSLVAVADRDFAEIATGGRDALARYVSAGGNILLAGDPVACRAFADEVFAGSLKILAKDSPVSESGGFPYGLGTVFIVPATDFSSFEAKDLPEATTSTLFLRMLYSQAVFTARYLDCLDTNPYFSLDIADHLAIPQGLFIGILIVFVLVAGPLMLWWLGRRNRRIWMLWLLPAVSFVFSVAIISGGILKEGVFPYEVRDALTLLSQGDGRAVTIGGVSVYSPIALSGGIDFDRGDDINLVEAAPVAMTLGGPTIRYAGSCIVPRTPSVFAVRRTDLLRERLEVVNVRDDAVEVVNALGAPLKELFLWDAQGRLFHGGKIASGAKATLKPADEVSAGLRARLGAVFALGDLANRCTSGDFNWGQMSDSVLPGPHRKPNFASVYAAEFDGACPFLEDVLGKRKAHRKDSGLVFGSFRGAGEVRHGN